MKRYLSFGGGVNSVALMLLLEDMGVEFEAVYCDHGGDWTETRDYIAMLQAAGHRITIIKPNVEGCENLYDYALWRRIAPSMLNRWCTDKFKVRPLNDYFKRPAQVFIGFACGEEKRQARRRPTEGVWHTYPLIDLCIDREGCKEVIAAHGLPIPDKSGCFFCPFQRVAEWRRLRDEHPCLFAKARELEMACIERRKAQGKPPWFLTGHDRPLDTVVREGQPDLFGWRKPCECNL